MKSKHYIATAIFFMMSIFILIMSACSSAAHTFVLSSLFLSSLDALPVEHTLAPAERKPGGPAVDVVPLLESRTRTHRENMARKERSASGKQGVKPGALKRSLEELSAEAQTLCERVAGLKGTKRAKYEAKQQKRDEYAKRKHREEQKQDESTELV